MRSLSGSIRAMSRLSARCPVGASFPSMPPAPGSPSSISARLSEPTMSTFIGSVGLLTSARLRSTRWIFEKLHSPQAAPAPSTTPMNKSPARPAAAILFGVDHPGEPLGVRRTTRYSPVSSESGFIGGGVTRRIAANVSEAIPAEFARNCKGICQLQFSSCEHRFGETLGPSRQVPQL